MEQLRHVPPAACCTLAPTLALPSSDFVPKLPRYALRYFRRLPPPQSGEANGTGILADFCILLHAQIKFPVCLAPLWKATHVQVQVLSDLG